MALESNNAGAIIAFQSIYLHETLHLQTHHTPDLSISPSLYPPTHSSICIFTPSTKLFTSRSICNSPCPSIHSPAHHLFTYSSSSHSLAHPSAHSSIQIPLAIHLSTYIPTCQSSLPIHLPIHLSIYSSHHLSIHLSIYFLIYPSLIHATFYLFIH